MKIMKKRRNACFAALNEGNRCTTYVLALPESKERNILDIYNSLELIQPHYRGRDKYIVGLAHGKENAIELAASIVGEMYNMNKNFDIRTFLNFRENSFSDREG